MQGIRIAVVRDSRYRSVDGFHIYGDRGTGAIDWVHPMTPRRLLFWEDALGVVPHLAGGHLMGFHQDSVRREGHLTGTHLLDEQGLPAGTSVFEVGPFVFGRFQHVVVTEDELGNRQQAGVLVYETVVNSSPPPASELRVESYDRETGVATLLFTPSARLTG